MSTIDDELEPPLPPDAPPPPRRAALEPDAPRVSRETVPTIPLPRPQKCRIIAVANQKGGVGKTTSVVNVAVALAQGGLNVLVIDIDPQGNASTALGVDHSLGVAGTYETLIDGVALEDVTSPSPESENLRVVPATIDLAAAELELVAIQGRETRLQRALETYLSTHDVDYVLIDCPPSLGLLTLNALVAANEIFIPIQCEYYALEGLTQLLRTISLVIHNLNPSLRLSTVLMTMFDSRTRLATQVVEEVRRHYRDETLETLIPRSVRLSEAPGFGQTVMTYDPHSIGAHSYRRAAQEIAKRGIS